MLRLDGFSNDGLCLIESLPEHLMTAPPWDCLPVIMKPSSMVRGKKQKRFYIPIYTKPKNLISADLGQFSAEWKGKRISGRLRNNRLVPYHSRREIDNGVLRGKGLELLWVDSAADAFFLHVQGSGRIKMTNGQTVRVGFAAKNGRPYVAIGRVLIKRGAIAKENVSMQSHSCLACCPFSRSRFAFCGEPVLYFFPPPEGNRYGWRDGCRLNAGTQPRR